MPRDKDKREGTAAAGDKVLARAYTSPTLVLLAMDWPAGAKHTDFLGFAIARAPGFRPNEKDGYLVNKIGFLPPHADSQPLPSSLSPIQKFLWWDSAISDADRGRPFTYTVIPVLGTGPNDLELQHQSELSIDVTVPKIERDGISTWFNRAVVSSQAFSREFPDPKKDIDRCMAWLANGLQNAFTAILKGATEIDGAIYHLTDKEWVMPALKDFSGALSIVYENRSNDHTDKPAIDILKKKRGFSAFGRTKTNIMHDKFLVDVTGGRVLTGSANFTPEGLTSQANLLHIFQSAELAELYDARQKELRKDPTKGETAKGAAWSDPLSIGAARLRVFFSPEPKNERISIDTVVKAVKNAKGSVIFCMFDPTDPALIRALLATGDEGKLLYGLLNSISDPTNKKEDLSDSGEAPKHPSPATQIKITLYNRSQRDKKVTSYSYFHDEDAPTGFLPELSSVDFSSKSTLPPVTRGKKRFVPAVHIHHKFIVIDAETDHPIIYTGSANLSKNSTNNNDENLLEITECPELAQTYFAEFMRLYEHYRARALWNMVHPAKKRGRAKAAPPEQNPQLAKTFTLKTKRDDWVRGAYKRGTLEYLARTTLA
ncbi:MAG TPA: phospholipase D-like domain-containing protein [Xanthobacteraceae bacterium]|nr:phospholipase D-like domain-containing protein [Xanthobacteraceae bacterium]